MTDTGLQPERTTLAWKRTHILLVLVACLALRSLQHHPMLSLVVITLAGLMALLIVVQQGSCYRRARLGIAQQGPTCNPRPLLTLCLCTALLATLTLFAVLAQA
ncbi:DUF202 domain-containing protein [Pseudomonas plecoglossicida]|uniref:DUF202 domain-containing protein n=1 Tax=Pseudomonas plecoglossicida TaxID=70775 RepID=A0AAD0R2S4_PSEDL|nr:DUF202 domain-containing protein [Pseudomonas plecoglossicida]QLB57943.1 DUF202 domain-containing protein [Pseudomonas plecoglossicida]